MSYKDDFYGLRFYGSDFRHLCYRRRVDCFSFWSM